MAPSRWPDLVSVPSPRQKTHSLPWQWSRKFFLPPLNELNTMFKHHVRKKKKEGNPSHPLWYTLVFAIIRTANWILLIQRVCGLPTWCSWVSLPTPVTHEYTSNPKYFVYCLNRFLLLVPFPFGQITQGVSFSHKSKCKTKNTVLGIKEDTRLWILLGVGGSFSRETSLKENLSPICLNIIMLLSNPKCPGVG